MAKTVVFMMVSLDGFTSGPGGDLSWHNVDTEFNDFAAKQLKSFGSLVFGTTTFKLMADYWPTEAGKLDDPIVAKLMSELPKFVVSSSLNTTDWQNTEFLTGLEDLERVKQAETKDMLILGSNSLCTSLLNTDLLDELRIMVNPCLVHEGRQLFIGLTKRLDLKLVSSRQFKSGNVLLTYDT